MDTNWLDDLVCLARTSSFTRAAELRDITQSAFSRRIRSLERWAGVELVDRSGYPPRLTRAGEALLPLAADVVLRLRQSRDELRRRERGDLETVRFAAPHAVSVHHLMPLIHRLETALPGIRTRVLSDDLHTCCETFEEGLCDILVHYRHARVALALDERRYTRFDLLEEALVPVCAPAPGGAPRWRLPESPEPGREPIPFLAYAPGSFLGAVVEHALSGRDELLATRHVDAFAEALKSLALHGSGVAWLPAASIRDELARGRLVAAGGAGWSERLTLSLFVDESLGGAPGSRVGQVIANLTGEAATGAPGARR